MATSESPHPASPARTALGWLVKVAVSAALLIVLFTRLDAAHLWQLIRSASPVWIVAALGLYAAMVAVSTWRWRLLLQAQQVHLGFRPLMNSFLVAVFANNFLPSNIGGDVLRVRDTARPAGSKTLATAVVLADRGVGILGLGFVAACGSTLAARRSDAFGPVGPGLLWLALVAAIGVTTAALAMPQAFGRLAHPLRVFHREWVDQRIALITGALVRFRRAPGAMLAGFAGAIVVQIILVAYYEAVALALHLSIPFGHLAILVPVSFLVQMVPVSLNGLGVREATFGLYLTRIGVPLESAIALSFIGAGLVAVFSLTGAAAYISRRRRPAPQALPE